MSIEVVRGPDDAPEGMEEIAVTPFVNKPLQRHAGAVVALKGISDAYFYSDGKAPKGKRSEELVALIDSMPVAQTAAQSIGEYEEQLEAKEKAAAKPVEKPRLKVSPAVAAVIAKRPLELQPAPAETVTAVLISEVEFKKYLASQKGKMLDVLKVENPDELFVSERDGQPYVVGYGPTATGKPRDVVAYEKEGVDGKRMVGYSTGVVVELDEQQFREAVPK